MLRLTKCNSVHGILKLPTLESLRQNMDRKRGLYGKIQLKALNSKSK